MAYSLTSTDIVNLRQAINLLDKSDAPQLVHPTGIHESIVQQISKVAAASGFMNVGKTYESLRDNPISTLLHFILFVGNIDNSIFIQEAADSMTLESARELPLHENVIQSLSHASDSFATPASFTEALKNSPVSTLLKFLLFAGTGGALTYYSFTRDSDSSLVG